MGNDVRLMMGIIKYFEGLNDFSPQLEPIEIFVTIRRREKEKWD